MESTKATGTSDMGNSSTPTDVPSAPPSSEHTTVEVVLSDRQHLAGVTPYHREDLTPDVRVAPVKRRRFKSVLNEFGGTEEFPTNFEIYTWYLYGLCSYFILTFVIPLLFPLIISQVVSSSPNSSASHLQARNLESLKDNLHCRLNEMNLYNGLTQRSIKVLNSKFSPLEWTALSWGIGIVLVSPTLFYLSPYLDHGPRPLQKLIFTAAILIGSLSCLPVGFFKVKWIFIPYTISIVIGNVVSTAFETRHLGLMVRGFFMGSSIQKNQFHERKNIVTSLSLYGTAAGCVAAAAFSAFTYHMLHYTEKLTSLWVVSIFSGLLWFIGTLHALSANRPSSETTPASTTTRTTHLLSLFKYPHAVGSLVSVLISSFTSTCIFMGGLHYVVGQLCVKPVFLLFLFLIYFIFPLFSLPLFHPLQLVMKTDAVRMQFLGFFVSAITSGSGFYFKNKNWNHVHLSILVACQSLSVGVLHAFGRVLLLDCTPPNKEGVFSVWFAWTRAVGACIGFIVSSAYFDKVGITFGITFCSVLAGMIVLVLGKVSHFSGAVAAGHVVEEEENVVMSEKGSPDDG
ncbi:hypothetical protein MKW92_050966 [Papaver armeniacum]|nr:hypothetical protein MKW92_050966 [Papaver armeniacum]